ncbi:MAG: 3-deoxy-8-phosphooctulonate synthase [Planctomycetes bacterium]|jgi:2-dehydro-3-deoxyphosphooctonate aldolase (KDO 8-P synthase)|nr:3-deoxy-8-phosphooctulonate synthase [Planctomycetota bacterium]
MDPADVAVERSPALSRVDVCTIGGVGFGGEGLSIIAGPCMAESLDLCLHVARTVKDICGELGIGYVFKASFDKANRSSVSSYRGPGLETGLEWLAEVGQTVGVPVLTDIHEPGQATLVAQAVDCLQIPAFLARQTDLLVTAGETGKPVNVKKAQFMAPWDMQNVVEKVQSTGNDQILLTERGTSFGYNRLVSDMRSIPQMQVYAPVVFDATHSVQQPGGLGNASGGDREFVPVLAAAAIAAGADALFLETHLDPDNARSDAASQLATKDMASVLKTCLAIYKARSYTP